MDQLTSDTIRTTMEQMSRFGGFIGLSERTVALAGRAILVLLVAGLCYAAYFIARRIILRFLLQLIHRAKVQWDETLIERGILNRLAHLVPAILIYKLAPVVFFDLEALAEFCRQGAGIYMVVIGILLINAGLNVFQLVYLRFPVSREIPISGFVQVIRILAVFAGLIWILSLLMGQTPWYFLSGLGAMTAVLLLIFKDAILGLVAGIQLTANNMVRPGDWIEMPKHGADGDVMDMTLTTVKVRNFDKTIVFVPTYALVSDSFKNWRGMTETGGRRVMRAVRVDQNSIKFCTQEMLDRFRKIQYISEYIDRKLVEIADYNRQHNVDESEIVNGRHLTNIGTFRAYIEAYLRNHPKIRKDLTLMVRLMPPSENGLPVEIYAFADTTEWERYETIQADIFDHVLAALRAFDLRPFQRGSDFSAS